MKHVKATYYLPLADNDGRSLAAEIAEVEDAVFDSFGSWTLSGFFKGVWRMESGERKFDTSAVYVVILERSQVEKLRAILMRFKQKTVQEAIYLEILEGVELTLV